MFEYSLENGKQQLIQGLCCFIGTAIAATALVLCVSFIKNPYGVIATAVLFGLMTALFSILFVVKTIFGAVVYHAERTSTRSEKVIETDYLSSYTAPANVKNTYSLKDARAKARKDKSPIVKVIHNETKDEALFILADRQTWKVSRVNEKISDWESLSLPELKELFYSKLINYAELQK